MNEYPSDIKVESSVLGEILIGSEAGQNCIHLLTHEHFFSNAHKTIFDLIVSMTKAGKAVDAVTVTSEIKSLGILETSGGLGYVMELSTMAGMLLPEKYIQILEEKRKLRRIIELSEISSSKAFKNQDSDQVLNEIADELFKINDKSNSGNVTQSSVISVLDNLQRKKNGEVVTGIKTGIDVLDRLLGGFKPLFYTLASRARMGKTSLIAQIIKRIIIEKRPTLLFEKDMSPELFILRMACMMANVAFSKYDLGYSTHAEIEDIEKAIKFIDKSPLYIYSPSNFTVQTFSSIIKKEKRTHGIECVFLDHILNMDVGKDYRTGLTLASSRIRDSVEENKIPHIILAQLNRGAHNCERPNASHIKEFDALFADCDVMAFLWSEKEFVDVPPSELFPMKLTCGKNRYGSEFEEDIYFDRPLLTFRNKKI